MQWPLKVAGITAVNYILQNFFSFFFYYLFISIVNLFIFFSYKVRISKKVREIWFLIFLSMEKEMEVGRLAADSGNEKFWSGRGRKEIGIPTPVVYIISRYSLALSLRD